jgi:hypothetical protein
MLGGKDPRVGKEPTLLGYPPPLNPKEGLNGPPGQEWSQTVIVVTVVTLYSQHRLYLRRTETIKEKH